MSDVPLLSWVLVPKRGSADLELHPGSFWPMPVFIWRTCQGVCVSSEVAVPAVGVAAFCSNSGRAAVTMGGGSGFTLVLFGKQKASRDSKSSDREGVCALPL